MPNSPKKKVFRSITIHFRKLLEKGIHYHLKAEDGTIHEYIAREGDILFYIKNDKKVFYWVILNFHTMHHQCSCPAHVEDCYHVQRCIEYERSWFCYEQAIRTYEGQNQYDPLLLEEVG